MELKLQTLTTNSLDTQAPTPVTLITLVGDIDGNTAPGVQADVLAAAAPDSKMILDMTGVPYMSSAGLRVLLAVYRQMTAQNSQVVLVGLAEEIRDTMEVTGFLDFFTATATLDEAYTLLQLQPV